MTQQVDRVRTVVGELARDRSGGVAILFMFLAIGLFGFVALAVDTSMWYATKRRMQTAADAAARAGAHQLLRVTVTNDEIVASAVADAAKYGFASEKGAVVNVLSDKTAATVETSISMPASLNFAQFFMAAAPTVKARAVAAAPQTPPPCLTLLEPTTGPALSLGGGTKVSSPSCRLQVNSTANNGLQIKGSALAEAAQICTAGSYSGGGTTVPVEKCAALPDPLSFWQPPIYSGCDESSPTSILSQTRTIANPSQLKVYCDTTITIKTSTVRFDPGTYVLKNTNLTIDASTINGDGVGFLLVGTSKVSITGGRVSFSAPRQGQMAGMIFAHSRDATPGIVHLFGDADVRYEGAFYLPNQDVTYAGQTRSNNVPPFTTFIVRRLTLTDQANLVLNNNYAGSDVPVVGKIGSGVVLSQ